MLSKISAVKIRIPKEYMQQEIVILNNFTMIGSPTPNFTESYKNYYSPVWVENSFYADSNIKQLNMTGQSTGDNFQILMTTNESRFYKWVDGVKKQVKYIDRQGWDKLTLEEQEKEYFTLYTRMKILKGTSESLKVSKILIAQVEKNLKTISNGLLDQIDYAGQIFGWNLAN